MHPRNLAERNEVAHTRILAAMKKAGGKHAANLNAINERDSAVREMMQREVIADALEAQLAEIEEAKAPQEGLVAKEFEDKFVIQRRDDKGNYSDVAEFMKPTSAPEKAPAETEKEQPPAPAPTPETPSPTPSSKSPAAPSGTPKK